jgi:hypothetical protein
MGWSLEQVVKMKEKRVELNLEVELGAVSETAQNTITFPIKGIPRSEFRSAKLAYGVKGHDGV